jgi:transposase
VQSLLAQVQQRDTELTFKQALIDKLTHEMAILKRMKFAATSERFASTLSPEQRSLEPPRQSRRPVGLSQTVAA